MQDEKRNENRLRVSWPLWFGHEGTQSLRNGQLIDVSRSAVSFRVSGSDCPQLGQHIATRFSYPCHANRKFQMASYKHWSEVIRVDTNPHGGHRVVLRLHEKLPCEPTEANSGVAMSA